MSAKKSKRQAEKEKAEELLDAQAEAEVEAAYGKPGRKMTTAEEKAWLKWKSKDRRARYGKLPKPPEPGDVEFLYKKLHDDLRHLNDSELVMTVVNTAAWQSTVGARCRELDAAANPRRAYTTLECEIALLYQRMLGKRTYAAASKELASADASGWRHARSSASTVPATTSPTGALETTTGASSTAFRAARRCAPPHKALPRGPTRRPLPRVEVVDLARLRTSELVRPSWAERGMELRIEVAEGSDLQLSRGIGVAAKIGELEADAADRLLVLAPVIGGQRPEFSAARASAGPGHLNRILPFCARPGECRANDCLGL